MDVKSCVGCGYCCIKTPCDVSRRLYGSHITECPKLEWLESESRYSCGLMMLQGDLGYNYRKELYAGAGCCASLNSWRKDVKRRSGISTQYTPLPSLMQKLIACMAREFVSADSVYLMSARLSSLLKNDGYCDEEIEFINTNIQRIYNEHRSSFMKEFTG